jgi:exopolyphosphatase/guanosine-5'-triphosphate,3'-diphosphate pyrophosphatase
MHQTAPLATLAAIDIGSNAIRLEIAQGYERGRLTWVHEERDPVRPGEGAFHTGMIGEEVATRIVAVLRHYAVVCGQHQATVRAVATSAVREARNREDLISRIHRETGLVVEAISGEEEARLMCLGILSDRPASTRALCLDIGGGSTEIAVAERSIPIRAHSMPLGSVRLTEHFRCLGQISKEQLGQMRTYAAEITADHLPLDGRNLPDVGLGSSGSIRGIVGAAAYPHAREATTDQITEAVDKLAAMNPDERRRAFDTKRAEVIVAGAVILETVAKHLRLRKVVAVKRGLRHGVLIDLLRREERRLHPGT